MSIFLLVETAVSMETGTTSGIQFEQPPTGNDKTFILSSRN